MRTLLFIFLVVFSTASLAHKHKHCHYGHGHHHHHAHYGYGYTNFFFVPGNVYERDVYRVRGGYVVERDYPVVRYWPYRTRVHYDYYRPVYNRYWWW